MHTTLPVDGKRGFNCFLTRRSPCPTHGTLARHLGDAPEPLGTVHLAPRRSEGKGCCIIAMRCVVSRGAVHADLAGHAADKKETLHAMACTTTH
jgi:hypothetical protein